MATQDLEKRVENLEHSLQLLNTMPARIGNLETQFLQFRQETRDEFSAVNARLDALASSMSDMARQMRLFHEDVIARIATIQRG